MNGGEEERYDGESDHDYINRLVEELGYSWRHTDHLEAKIDRVETWLAELDIRQNLSVTEELELRKAIKHVIG